MKPRVAIVGAGPAGLMAAEIIVGSGVAEVTVFDATPSPGRKFLMAGKGGMNITHDEPFVDFVTRYGSRRARIEPFLQVFGPQQLRAWIHGLGIETFVGTSGRVFPSEMKAAPLLRAWLHRLRTRGVHFCMRHRWQGWHPEGELRFSTPSGELGFAADATVLAMGGASWPQLGSDGAWMPLLAGRGVAIAPLRPANCGFDVAWSEHFRLRHAGSPVKPVVAKAGELQQQGEFNVTENGIEGGLIYACSAILRDTLERDGRAALLLDLAPGRTLERLQADLARPRGRDSLSNHLRRRAGIEGVKAAMLRELCSPEQLASMPMLAAAIKALPLPVVAARPLAEAISTAGGVRFEGLDERLMLKDMPGVFCAGEMLDWEAPTGGYLLTACLSTGHAAGCGVKAWLNIGD